MSMYTIVNGVRERHVNYRALGFTTNYTSFINIHAQC